jgi:AcrR family transcriptional regulator
MAAYVGGTGSGQRRALARRGQERAEPDDPDLAAPARLGRRERNKLAKRKRIVTAARRLFASKGFAQTTTQEIAERADIGAGTLFLYVKSKEDLLVLVFRDEMIETTRAAFERADRDAPLVDQLLSVFESMIDYHERDVELTRILLREVFFPSVPERVDDIRELMRVIYQHIGERMLERRQAESIREDLDPRATAEVLFSAYLMVLLVWLRGEISRGQFSSRLRTLLNTVFDGLRR